MYLTINEAAQMLNVSPRTLYNIINRRELESVTIGRLVRIPREALDRYIDAHRRPATGARR